MTAPNAEDWLPSRQRRTWLLATPAAAPGSTVARAPLRLSLNENAFGASPRARRPITAALAQVHRYVEQSEVDALVSEIAALERVDPTQIVLGEILEPLGLHLASRLRQGEVVYSTPGYTALLDAGAALGMIAHGVPLNAALENDLHALAAAVGARTLAVSLVNPHNPSGTVGDAAKLHAFITDTARRTLVIVDEAYLEYDRDFGERSAVRHVRDGANVLVFRTLAKIYGLAGLAIGYAIAPSTLAAQVRAAGIGAPHTLNRLSLAAAQAALADQSYVWHVRDRTAHERARLTAALDQLGWRHSDSHADFVFFEAPAPDALRSRFTAAGIAIGKPFPPLDRWLRISTGTPPETDRVLAVLNQQDCK